MSGNKIFGGGYRSHLLESSLNKSFRGSQKEFAVLLSFFKQCERKNASILQSSFQIQVGDIPPCYYQGHDRLVFMSDGIFLVCRIGEDRLGEGAE